MVCQFLIKFIFMKIKYVSKKEYFNNILGVLNGIVIVYLFTLIVSSHASPRSKSVSKGNIFSNNKCNIASVKVQNNHSLEFFLQQHASNFYKL